MATDTKAEGWMVQLAYLLAVVDWEAGKVVTEERLGSITLEPTDQLIDGVCRLIAAHAPKPEDQPIRRGDVVQCVRNGDDPRYGPIVGETRVVTRVSKDGWLHFDTSFFHDPSRFTRIGRARFMPDGTLVED